MPSQPRKKNGQWGTAPRKAITPPIPPIRAASPASLRVGDPAVAEAWRAYNAAFRYRGVGEEEYVDSYLRRVEYHEHTTRDFGDGETWQRRTTRSLASGELADRVRLAFGVEDPEEDVTIVYISEDGGYSQHTRENDYSHTIECAGHSREFDGYGSVDKLVEWLDEAAPMDRL